MNNSKNKIYLSKTHNCVKELRRIIDDQQSKINQLSNEVMKQKTDLETYIHELKILKVLSKRNCPRSLKHLLINLN